MIETHPFGDFVPRKAKYLILGSFTGRQSYDWFYGTKVNQFWSIFEGVYGISLKTKADKQRLFTKLGIAIADIVYQCERAQGTNMDNNLINIVYNTRGIKAILAKNKIAKIFFSSRFVESLFKKVFNNMQLGDTELITLPSPSPRYAAMKLADKIKKYRKLLPR